MSSQLNEVPVFFDLTDTEKKSLPDITDAGKYIESLIHRLKKSWAEGTPLRQASRNLISKQEVIFMLLRSVHVLFAEPNVLELQVDCDKEVRLTVVGDTHGQFYDVLGIFQRNGFPSEKNIYVFNGDFVDRGPFSFQVIFLLLCLKALFPSAVYLLKGNHENKQMNMNYGFTDEILAKYDIQVLRTFWSVFRCLPLAAIVTQSTDSVLFKAFVVHGGIIPAENLQELKTLDRFNFNKLNRKEKKLVTDLLWSDPQKELGIRKNTARGAGMWFGPDATKKFLSTLKLKLLIRSHQMKQNGFCYEHDNSCLTIFSCPNYCDTYFNQGAYLVFSKETQEPQVQLFSAVEHPPLSTSYFSSRL